MSVQPISGATVATTYPNMWVGSAVIFGVLIVTSIIGGMLGSKMTSNLYLSKVLIVIPMIFVVTWLINTLAETDNSIKKCQSINSSILLAWVIVGTLIYVSLQSKIQNITYKCADQFPTNDFCQSKVFRPFVDSLIYGIIIAFPSFFLYLANPTIMTQLGC